MNLAQEKDPSVRQVIEATRQIAQKISIAAVQDEPKQIFRRDLFDEIAKAGLTRLIFPKELGGAAKSHFHYYAMLEELSRHSPSMAVTVGVTHLAMGILLEYATPAQKEQYLKKLITGEWIGAFSLSESGSGSDAASLKCQAKKTNGGYLLNGTKTWCSSGGYAELIVLFARTSEDRTKGITAFIIQKGMKGFRPGKKENTLGLRGSGLYELVFEDCLVPESQRLGQEGEGLKIALGHLDLGRIGIGTTGIGIATETLGMVFSAGLGEGIENEFAGYYAQLVSSRSLLREAARLRGEKQSLTEIASVIKLLGSDLAMQVTSHAVSAFGSEGVMHGNKIERLFRDAKALQIVEGINQVQTHVLTRELRKKLGNR